jgi:hypothetical protein
MPYNPFSVPEFINFHILTLVWSINIVSCIIIRAAFFFTFFECVKFRTQFLIKHALITLTLSSPMMPFGIILLILFFICYNFGRLERVNPFQSKKNCRIFWGLERVNPFQPPKNCSMWWTELKVWCHMAWLGWKGLKGMSIRTFHPRALK